MLWVTVKFIRGGNWLNNWEPLRGDSLIIFLLPLAESSSLLSQLCTGKRTAGDLLLAGNKWPDGLITNDFFCSQGFYLTNTANKGKPLVGAGEKVVNSLQKTHRKESIKLLKGTFAEDGVKLESTLEKLLALFHVVKDEAKMEQDDIYAEVRCHLHHDFIITSICVSACGGVTEKKGIDLMSGPIVCWSWIAVTGRRDRFMDGWCIKFEFYVCQIRA